MENLNDLSRPLIVNIGCGFGLSLIGLALLDAQSGCASSDDVAFADFNFVGGNLSQLARRSGHGIATQWFASHGDDIGMTSLCSHCIHITLMMSSYLDCDVIVACMNHDCSQVA